MRRALSSGSARSGLSFSTFVFDIRLRFPHTGPSTHLPFLKPIESPVSALESARARACGASSGSAQSLGAALLWVVLFERVEKLHVRSNSDRMSGIEPAFRGGSSHETPAPDGRPHKPARYAGTATGIIGMAGPRVRWEW